MLQQIWWLGDGRSSDGESTSDFCLFSLFLLVQQDSITSSGVSSLSNYERENGAGRRPIFGFRGDNGFLVCTGATGLVFWFMVGVGIYFSGVIEIKTRKLLL